MRNLGQRIINNFPFIAQASSRAKLLNEMESFTDLSRNSALKNLEQKTQASLMFSLLAKMPSSQKHPLNALRTRYFLGLRESELGIRMYVLLLLAKCAKQASPDIYCKYHI